MSAMKDGSYDVFVVDANDLDDGSMRIEMTITTGELKGEVIALTARNMRVDAVALLGTPGTLTVVDGVPRLSFD